MSASRGLALGFQEQERSHTLLLNTNYCAIQVSPVISESKTEYASNKEGQEPRVGSSVSMLSVGIFAI